jgi:hypothetical protein
MSYEKLNNLLFLRVALPVGPNQVGLIILASRQGPILSPNHSVLCMFITFTAPDKGQSP